MKVRNQFLFAVSMFLLVATVWSVVSQFLFLSRAEHVTGVVRELRAVNTRCGRRSWSRCTKFLITVELPSSAGQQTRFMEASRVKGHDQPLSKARYQIGDRVPVVFDPGRSDEDTFHDELSDVWATPFALLFLQLATLVASTFKRGPREPDEPVTLDLSGRRPGTHG